MISSTLAASHRPETGNATELVSLESILDALPGLTAEIARDAARRERERELPHQAFALVRAARLGALRVPVSLGGPGGSVKQLMETVSTLAAADSNVAHALRSHFNFVETILLASAERRSPYIGPILDGTLFGGAHTEIGTARPGEIRTRLSRTEDGYRLNGRKFYATGAMFADRLFITALDEYGTPASVEIDPARKGVAILDDWDGMGQRLTSSGSIVFDDVEVAPHEIDRRERIERDDVIGRHTATFRQIYLAACQAGIVRNVLSDAVSFVQTKARPITHSHAEKAADDMFVQRNVGLISARSFAIDALIAAAAEQIDRAHDAAVAKEPDIDELLVNSALATARAQAVISELSQEAAKSIFDTGGGSATSRALNFDRHWRNIRTILAHNPTDYKLQVIGANALTRTPPPLSGGFF